VHNAQDAECALMVWDSVDFDEGPIARIPLGDLLPWCVHGTWIPDYVGEEQG
jgi:carotenoid cleavage dioxygenase-like enzyme